MQEHLAALGADRAVVVAVAMMRTTRTMQMHVLGRLELQTQPLQMLQLLAEQPGPSRAQARLERGTPVVSSPSLTLAQPLHAMQWKSLACWELYHRESRLTLRHRHHHRRPEH